MWTKQYPYLSPSGDSTFDLIKRFDKIVVDDMVNNYGESLVKQDPNGERIVDISRRMDNMKESKHQVSKSVMDDIRSEIGPFMDDLYTIAIEIDRQNEQQRLQEALEKQNKKNRSK